MKKIIGYSILILLFLGILGVLGMVNGDFKAVIIAFGIALGISAIILVAVYLIVSD